MTDMNPHESNERLAIDERLSAYFDGEASPTERAAVESLLDDSLAARRDLDEISQLSALLHSFPRESAPSELVANVQRQTDQMPLVASAVTAAVPARSLRREWTAAVSGAVVTAAALFMMASLVDRTDSQRLTKSEQGNRTMFGVATDGVTAERGSFTASSTVRLVEGQSPPADNFGGEAGPLAMRAAPKMAASTVATAPTGDTANDNAPTIAGAVADTARQTPQNLGPGTGLTLTDNGAAQNFYVNNLDFLNGLKVGEVYQFVPQVADNGNNVAVVDLAVLDVERGVDQVQVLLSQNRIQPRLAGSSNDLEKQKSQKLRDQAKASASEMVVVYTVGPGEQLAKTLEDMQRHPDLFLGWSSQPPVQLPSGEELAAAKEDSSIAKGTVSPAEKPSTDKSGTAGSNADRKLAQFRKDATTADDSVDEEAELAINAFIARNTLASNSPPLRGLANVNVKILPPEMAADAKPISRAGADVKPPAPTSAGDSPTVTTQSTKSLPANLKDAPSNATSSRTVADVAGQSEPAAKKSGEQVQDANARRELERRSSYQTTFRVPADAAPLAEQTQQLNRFNTQNFDNTLNRTRRGTGNGMPQQSEANRVKVLFVLHPMPAPTTAPTGKPIP